MATRNNNARSKQNRRKLKRKSLLTNNRQKSIIERKIAKSIIPPKGKTITGEAKLFAIDYHEVFPTGGGGWLFDHGFRKSLNQRQKRKRIRWAA